MNTSTMFTKMTGAPCSLYFERQFEEKLSPLQGPVLHFPLRPLRLPRPGAPEFSFTLQFRILSGSAKYAIFVSKIRQIQFISNPVTGEGNFRGVLYVNYVSI